MTAEPSVPGSPEPRAFQDLDEFASSVGTHLGYSGWHQVTQDHIDAFADLTGDHQWIHTSPEKAAAGPHGSTIAHGFLTVSLIPKLLMEIYRVRGLKIAVNYGCDRLRLTAPVRVGARLRAGAELVEINESSFGSRARLRVVVDVESDDKPACVVDYLLLLSSR